MFFFLASLEPLWGICITSLLVSFWGRACIVQVSSANPQHIFFMKKMYSSALSIGSCVL